MNKPFVFFCILTVLGVLTSYLVNTVILTDDIYFYYLQSHVPSEKVDDILEVKNKWAWLGYITIPLIYLAKVCYVTFCLFIGAFLFGYSVSFRRLFEIVLKAEFIFFVPSLMILIWFGFFQQNYTLDDVENFHPWALSAFFDLSTIPHWGRYPLNALNIFELIYIVLISSLMINDIQYDFNTRLKLTLASYGSGLLLWILIVMFFIINLN